MRRQRGLVDHVLELFARAYPGTAVIDRGDPVKVLKTQLMRAIAHSRNASRVDCIVNSFKGRNGFLQHDLDILRIRDIGLD